MEEIGDIKKEGQSVNKSLVGVDMEAVDVGIGEPGPGVMISLGGGTREENVLFESSGGGGFVMVTDEAHGRHDWFQLLMRHNGLEGSRVPQGQFSHTLLHHL